MTPSLIGLPWLAPAPEDVSARIRALDGTPGEAGPRLQELAGMRLSGAQAASLGRVLKCLRGAGRDLAPLSPFRLAVLSGSTFDLIVDELPTAAIRHGVDLTVCSAPYDQVMQEALDPASTTNAGRFDAVLLALDHRWLQLEHPDLAQEAADRLATVVQALRRHGGAPVILQTCPPPPLSLFGSYDRRAAASARALTDEINRRIVALADETRSYLLDVAHLAERIGLDAWFDPVQWHAHKLPFAPACTAPYADLLGRLLGAVRGKARKCLVLDLDNTLWGGVIGDDGIEGIHLGQGHAMGEAFLAVQHLVLELNRRGVILAVCSKNDEATALAPFRDHPDMLMKEADVAVFRANWKDKPSNLMGIAQALNIGLDALVFLDDNPAERALMRAALPMVATPELPEDPSWYPWFLTSAGYFEAVGFSEEDALRAQSYAADAFRREAETSARDPGDYLRSLAMAVAMTPFDSRSRPRIAQLVNKTNQFNLTSRRYTEAEVEVIEDAAYTLQVRLKDRYGDFGMVAVAICRLNGSAEWEIDTWLMSCRVLGRRVEEAMLARIAADARSRGIARLAGVYRPTAKNGVVRDHYEKLGFTPSGEDADGALRFVVDLKDLPESALPFEILA